MVSILSVFFFCFPTIALSASFRQIFLPPTASPESLPLNFPAEPSILGLAMVVFLDINHLLASHILPLPHPTAFCDGATDDPDKGPICGRPFGLAYDPIARLLYIADAYYGLLVADSNGRLAKQIATGAEGQPFVFCNGLDIDPITRNIYFTDTSAVYDLRNSTKGLQANDSTGRLLKYDVRTNQVTVLMRNLSGAAGAAVSGDGRFVLVSEFVGDRIQRYWLTGSNAGTSEIILSNLNIVRPNNIKRTILGDFFIAAATVTQASQTPVPIRVRVDGSVQFRDRYGSTPISEAQQFGLSVYVSSRGVNFVAVPSAVFSQPPIGQVGLTEEQTTKEYGDIDVFTANFRPLKATLSGLPDRVFMKLIVCAKTNKVLGLNMCGEDSPEIVQGFAVAIKAGLTKEDFDSTVGIHPTAAEEFVTMRTPTRKIREHPPAEGKTAHDVKAAAGLALRPSPKTAMVSILSIFFFCFPTLALSASFRQIFLPPTGFGPESLAFEFPGGAFYTGVSDGRVLRYQPLTGFTYFAFTSPNRTIAFCDGATDDPDKGPICGRPFGLAYDPIARLLYIADAYYGLLVADSNGRLAKQIATGAEGQPFVFCNGLDIDPITRNIFFTDTSAVYDLRNSTKGLQANDSTGRLLKYDVRTNQVTVLMRNLSGAAGAAVSGDGRFVLVSEFIGNRIQRYWLTGSNAGTSEIILSNLNIVRPNNIKRTILGDFLIAAATVTQGSQTPVPIRVRVDGSGTISEIVSLEAQYGSTPISEAQQSGLSVYVSSRGVNFVGVYTP
uniref:Strictosidine synthase conserved region domain-containing protein n=1 Tax=Salix viminalis TaxID=40686 RepID=A0A6N2MAI4_SALVM